MDIIQKLSFEIDGVLGYISDYNGNSETKAFEDNIKRSLNTGNGEEVLFILEQIHDWYERNYDDIMGNDFVMSKEKEAHYNNKEKIANYIEDLRKMKKEAPLNFKQSENSKPGSKPLKQKIFISHSSDDKEVCKAFVDFLERLGIEEDQILYSSSSRHGIPAEMDIFNFLRGEIDGGITVYYMLSDNYYSSPYCLNEMGAAWVKQNDSKTFILPNLTGGIRGVIDDGNKGYALNDSYDLIQLKNNLCKEFNLKVTEGKFDDIKQNLLNEARNVHQ